jgi:tetratricopeptide (TPR) repeat protein
MMVRRVLLALSLALPVVASAQFVFPRPGYHEHDPSVYKEDPFVVHYRHEFFSVFQGDFARFDKAFAEIQAMVKKDPKDARALVWLGNGETVKAGVLWMQGKKPASIALMEHSRPLLDQAVALKPDDPGVFMMRAVTLYIQGQSWPDSEIPRENWVKLRDDCAHLVRLLGPTFAKTSLHVQGETYGEMGIADVKLGDKEAARAAFQKVIDLCPKTDYETRAKKEIEALGAVDKGAKMVKPEGSLIEDRH